MRAGKAAGGEDGETGRAEEVSLLVDAKMQWGARWVGGSWHSHRCPGAAGRDIVANIASPLPPLSTTSFQAPLQWRRRGQVCCRGAAGEGLLQQWPLRLSFGRLFQVMAGEEKVGAGRG